MIDPMAETTYDWTPYRYAFNNPLKFIDPNGMAEDWFENEVTGEVYYNTDMKKGDESQLGENWVHLGENGMFSEGKAGSSDVSVIAQNDNLATKASIDYDGGALKAEASFEGQNAETFMSNQGYQKVTKQAIQDIETNIVTGGSGTRGEVTVTKTRVTKASVEKIGYVPNSFEKVGSYRMKTPKPGQPIVGVGISTETVQYRFEYGQKSRAMKILDALIMVSSVQSGHIDISR